MTQTARGFATVRKGGYLAFENAPHFWSCVRGLDGQRVMVSVEPYRPVRSSQQNRWYWGVICQMVAQHLSKGRPFELHRTQAHYLLKSAFLGVDETPMGPVPKSSRELTTLDFSEYCERIVAHAASEWGLQIPQPEDE